MDQHIKVSILMPIYKVEQYLEKTLDSIFTQTYPYLDFVFVNDCSPDNSLQVLTNTIKKYNINDNQYTIVNHEQNEGIAVSRTDCIAHAKGDYVYFVDSDDWIEADYYATFNQVMELYGEAFYICGFVNHDEKYNNLKHLENSFKMKDLKDIELKGRHI